MKYLDNENIPSIIIIDNKKLGKGSISSYSYKDDIIFFNNYYHSLPKIERLTKQNLFVAKNISQIIKHELGHKLHWDAAKRFYQANKNKYNNIKEAKNSLDANLEQYISYQLTDNYSYLIENVSMYAHYSFRFAKENNKYNIVNEVIAEVIAANGSKDQSLNKIIMEELNYGRKS